MMDEMRVKLHTNFMKNIVSKLIAKFIYKKFGYKVNIKLDNLDIWAIDGDTTIKVNVEANIKSDDFKKLMKKLEED